VAPAITGVPRRGELMHANAGQWANAVTSYAYSWRRCDRAADTCNDIPGAAATSYRVTAADVGATLRVRVTAANAAGESSADSSPTAVVTAPSGARPNLVPGGTFEQSPKGARTTGATSVSWTRDQFRSPSHSLRFVSRTGAPVRWTTRAPAQAGGRYALSVWFKTSRLRGGVHATLSFWSASGVRLGRASAPAGSSRAWRRLSLGRVAPRGTAQVRVELGHRGAGTSWWDDLRLAAGRTGT
jgi:hypothetical protein